MRKPFSALRKSMTPERREKNRKEAARMLASLRLAEIREARNLSQEQIAELLDVDQTSVSEWEARSERFLSWLTSYVEALGGELSVKARFPDGDVEIDHHVDFDHEDNDGRPD